MSLACANGGARRGRETSGEIVCARRSATVTPGPIRHDRPRSCRNRRCGDPPSMRCRHSPPHAHIRKSPDICARRTPCAAASTPEAENSAAGLPRALGVKNTSVSPLGSNVKAIYERRKPRHRDASTSPISIGVGASAAEWILCEERRPMTPPEFSRLHCGHTLRQLLKPEPGSDRLRSEISRSPAVGLTDCLRTTSSQSYAANIWPAPKP